MSASAAPGRLGHRLAGRSQLGVPHVERRLHLGDARVGLVIDAFHFYVGNSSFDELERFDGARIFIAHLADVDHADRATLRKPNRVLPGDGVLPVRDLIARRKIEFDTFRKAVEQDVRFANITIIEGIGASQYGIGMLSARVAEVILRDERAVFPAGFYNPRFGTTVSLPSIVGRQGVIEVLEPDMSDEERQALERSAERLKETVRKYIGAR